MFAQALGEYGLLSRAAGSIEALVNDASLWMMDAGPGAWLAIGGVAVLLFWFTRRRK